MSNSSCAGEVHIPELQMATHPSGDNRFLPRGNFLQLRPACLRPEWGRHHQHGSPREGWGASEHWIIQHPLQEGAVSVPQAEHRLQGGPGFVRLLALHHRQVSRRTWGCGKCVCSNGRYQLLAADATQLGGQLDAHQLLREAIQGALRHQGHCQVKWPHGGCQASHSPVLPAGCAIQLQCAIAVLIYEQLS